MGAVVGGASSSLYFEWNGETSNDLPDEQIVAAAARVGLEMRALTASLSAPIDGTVAQPTISVRATSMTAVADAGATPAGSVRVAVYREAPALGVSDCVHVVAVNPKPITTKVDFFLAGVSGHTSRRRDCHSAAPPSPFSRCFMGYGGGVSKVTVSPTARPHQHNPATDVGCPGPPSGDDDAPNLRDGQRLNVLELPWAH